MREKSLETPLDSKDIEPVHPKGNQLWIFIERSVAEALIVCPPNTENWLIGKAPHARKAWRQKKAEGAVDEMVREHLSFNGHEFEQALGDGGGQRSLVCCSARGLKELEMT